MDRYKIVPMDWVGAQWFKNRMPMSFTQDTIGIVGWKYDEIVAGIVFSHRTPHSVEAHHIVEDPLILRNGWLEAIGECAFGESRSVVYTMISEGNPVARKFHKKLGFKDSGIIPKAFGEEIDGMAVYLLREDYRWLEENKDG